MVMDIRLERADTGSQRRYQMCRANCGSFQIRLAGKITRNGEMVLRIQHVGDQQLFGDFTETGERLFDKLRELLMTRGMPMILTVEMVVRGTKVTQMGSHSGSEFVETMFARHRKWGGFERTESFMQVVRL